ncbi:MAG: hypothetical protein WA784_13635 [Albidovulum sp.]
MPRDFTGSKKKLTAPFEEKQRKRNQKPGISCAPADELAQMVPFYQRITTYGQELEEYSFPRIPKISQNFTTWRAAIACKRSAFRQNA